MRVPLFIVTMTKLTVVSTTPAVYFVILSESQAVMLTSANVFDIDIVESLELGGSRTIFFIADTELTVIVQPPAVDFVLVVK